MRPSLRSDLAKRTKFAILLNKNTIDAISCQEAEKKINKTKLKTPINRHCTTTECFLKKNISKFRVRSRKRRRENRKKVS